MGGDFVHLFADFSGVPAPQLRDATLLSGLLIAAAGAAGFSTVGAPLAHTMPHGGVAGILLLDGCHMAVHTIPDRGLLLFDALAPATSNARKALDVFVRRLPAAHVRTEQRARG